MTDNTAFMREVDEDVRRERLENLWKKHGRVLIGVAVLAVMATAVLTYMRNEQNQKFEAATTQVAEVLQSLKDDNQAAVQSQLAELAPTLPSGQATIARLYASGLASESNERDKAIAALAEQANDAKAPVLYRDLARILSIQLRLDSDDPAKLRTELEPLMASGQPWRFSAREAAALLAIKTGDTATARDLYEQLKQDPDTPTSIRDRATKLSGTLN